MRDAPCGRADCPIVDPSSIDRRGLRIHTLSSGTEWYRVARNEHDEQPFAPPGSGDGRFSPLDRRAHCYLAEQRSVALLESALHEASGPNPRIYRAPLRDVSMFRLRLDTPVRLIDLRDDALEPLGIDRSALTGTSALHYPCTRLVAEHLVGTKSSTGFVWTSRQGHLHAERNPDGLASEVLQHVRLDVAVVYDPDASGSLAVLNAAPVTTDGDPVRLVAELANLLRIAIL